MAKIHKHQYTAKILTEHLVTLESFATPGKRNHMYAGRNRLEASNISCREKQTTIYLEQLVPYTADRVVLRHSKVRQQVAVSDVRRDGVPVLVRRPFAKATTTRSGGSAHVAGEWRGGGGENNSLVRRVRRFANIIL